MKVPVLLFIICQNWVFFYSTNFLVHLKTTSPEPQLSIHNPIPNIQKCAGKGLGCEKSSSLVEWINQHIPLAMSLMMASIKIQEGGDLIILLNFFPQISPKLLHPECKPPIIQHCPPHMELNELPPALK